MSICSTEEEALYGIALDPPRVCNLITLPIQTKRMLWMTNDDDAYLCFIHFVFIFIYTLKFP